MLNKTSSVKHFKSIVVEMFVYLFQLFVRRSAKIMLDDRVQG
jgi:hypothetical protein